MGAERRRDLSFSYSKSPVDLARIGEVEEVGVMTVDIDDPPFEAGAPKGTELTP